uniref:Uncharacterized protein n=1 Tax=Anser cygnoides TaxID=8845 RepID=A0A8B9DTJ1_ANSCY
MTIPGGLRSCTETNFSPDIFINSTLTPPTNSGSYYDITLLTLLVVASYSFCIIPLLASFTGKRSRFPLLWDVLGLVVSCGSISFFCLTII